MKNAWNVSKIKDIPSIHGFHQKHNLNNIYFFNHIYRDVKRIIREQLLFIGWAESIWGGGMAKYSLVLRGGGQWNFVQVIRSLAKVYVHSERQWVLMIEPSILKVFIKIKHHFVKINLQSPTESYEPFTFAICRRTGSGWNQQLPLKVWGIDELTKTLQ